MILKENKLILLENRAFLAKFTEIKLVTNVGILLK